MAGCQWRIKAVDKDKIDWIDHLPVLFCLPLGRPLPFLTEGEAGAADAVSASFSLSVPASGVVA